jgi:hypothetical protein
LTLTIDALSFKAIIAMTATKGISAYPAPAMDIVEGGGLLH